MVDDDRASTEPPARSPAAAGLDRAVRDLYGDLRLTPMLHSLLAHSRRAVDALAGSISIIDGHEGSYRKLAERGVPCRLGHSFPLDQGATGQAVRSRRPIVIDSYARLGSGHLPPDHPAAGGAAAAVPIWWRGDIIGVNVAFGGRRQPFTAAEVDALDVLSQTAAGALMTAGAQDPSLARLIRDQAQAGTGLPHAPTVVTEVGPARQVSPALAGATVAAVAALRHAAAGRSSGRLHVAVVYRPHGLRLLIQQEPPPLGERSDATVPGPAEVTWRRLIGDAGGSADIEDVPGWGVLLRAEIPDDLPHDGGTPADATLGGRSAAEATPLRRTPLTAREAEVLGLVARGMSDREIADHLVLSPKTVEKHVGATLRKTGAPSRTAAVMRAVAHGWLTA